MSTGDSWKSPLKFRWLAFSDREKVTGAEELHFSVCSGILFSGSHVDGHRVWQGSLLAKSLDTL